MLGNVCITITLIITHNAFTTNQQLLCGGGGGVGSLTESQLDWKMDGVCVLHYTTSDLYQGMESALRPCERLQEPTARVLPRWHYTLKFYVNGAGGYFTSVSVYWQCP